MGELEKPVARVFRRLRFQRFLTTLVWSWSIALAVVAATIGVEKLFNLTIPGPEWAPFAVAGLVGLVISAAVSLASGPSRMDAAVALDRVFHLNERVSSALSLPADLRETLAGRALIADAARKVADLDVAAEFGLRLPRRAWVVLDPGNGGGAAPLRPGMGSADRPGRNDESAVVDIKAIAKQAEMLTKKIASQRQAIDKEKFPEADKLLAKIEKKAQELAKAPPAGQRQTDGRIECAHRCPQRTSETARLTRAGQPPAPAAQGNGQPGAGRPVCQGPRQGRLQKGCRTAPETARKAPVGQDERGREKGPQGTAHRDVQEAERARQPRTAEEAARRGTQERRLYPSSNFSARWTSSTSRPRA